MPEKTKEMLRGWLKKHNGDAELLARWMARNLNVGGIKDCREMIAEAAE